MKGVHMDITVLDEISEVTIDVINRREKFCDLNRHVDYAVSYAAMMSSVFLDTLSSKDRKHFKKQVIEAFKKNITYMGTVKSLPSAAVRNSKEDVAAKSASLEMLFRTLAEYMVNTESSAADFFCTQALLASDVPTINTNPMDVDYKRAYLLSELRKLNDAENKLIRAFAHELYARALVADVKR